MKKNKPPIITKIVIYLVLAIFPLFIPPTTVKAQEPDEVGVWYDQTFKEWFLRVYDNTNPTEIFGERYTAAQVQWILYSIISLPFTKAKDFVNCSFSGDIGQCTEAARRLLSQVRDQNQKEIAANNKPQPKGIKDFLIEERELSGISYVRNLLRKTNPIPQAKAQEGGFGYNSLGFIQPMWRSVRDASYFFLIIAIVLFAFLIMFRVKISPQAVITVQNMLPKIIFALILITFSYAIAGFLVDLMYLTFAVLFKTIFPERSFLMAWSVFNGSSVGIILIFLIYCLGFLITIFLGFVFWITSNVINVLSIPLLLPIILVVIVITLLLLLIMLIFNFFKIVFMFIKNTALLLVAIIFSPLSIMADLVVGKSLTSFIGKIASKLSVFVVGGILMFLSLEFLIQSAVVSAQGITEENFVVDIINLILSTFGAPNISINIFPGNVWNPPFFEEGLMGFVLLGVSFATMSLIPKTTEIVQSAIEGRPFAYGTAIGEGIRPATTIGTGTLQYFATGSEMQYRKIPEGGEVPGGVARQKKFFDILRQLGTIK